MEKYNKISFALQQKVVKIENTDSELISFDWFVYAEDESDKNLVKNKEKVLLLQLFIIQQFSILASNLSGMKESFDVTIQNHDISEEELKICGDLIMKMFYDTMNRLEDTTQLMIEKPAPLKLSKT